ncbi:MAG: FadR family transcriptional regulator [Clostridiales bacterium]|jgi:DNA-binding FadR family transcriptional regulator|nr:FadR family transcriptional regulator [Clostridiales bacterium]
MVKRRGEKLYSLVFRQIRAYILQNNLQPGDLLPTEQALVDMLGVSRNVLREAIKSMELLGMVSAQPGRGTMLKQFNLDYVFQNVIFAAAGEEENAISEMLDIRKRLELAYTRQAFETLQQEDIARLRTILESIKKQWEEHRFFHADDREFHMALFSRIGNQTLMNMMAAIWDVDENFKTEEKFKHLDETIVKHENIVRALEAGNEEAFLAAMMAHFASGKYSKQAKSFEEF